MQVSKLVYSAIASLDGFVEDANGRFDWAAPDVEVHAFVNDLERPIGTYLYGRRMYQTMLFWESADAGDGSAVSGDYAEIWRAADKIVFSRTLRDVASARTTILREFESHAIESLKQSSATDISIGGAELAAHAMRAGLVDECHLFLAPVIVGGGKPALPRNLNAQLQLRDQHAFDSGFVHLQYEVLR